MATAASPALEQKLGKNPGKIGMIVFGVALLAGLIYTGTSIATDMGDMGNVRSTSTFLLFSSASRSSQHWPSSS